MVTLVRILNHTKSSKLSIFHTGTKILAGGFKYRILTLPWPIVGTVTSQTPPLSTIESGINIASMENGEENWLFSISFFLYFQQ